MRRTTIFRSELTLALAVMAIPLSAAAQQPAPQPSQPAAPIIRPHSGAAAAQSPQQPAGQGQQPAAPGQQPAARRPAAQQAAPSAPSGAFPQNPSPAPSGAFPQNPSAAVPGGGAFPQSAQAQQATPAVPATHTVAQGETLWALAKQYFGDALLWPEIYRLNTTVVEDPHWIYPGEELKLTATEDTAAAAAPTTGQAFLVNPPPDTTQPAEATPAPYVSPTTGPTIFSQQTVRTRAETALERLAARSYRAVRDGEYYSSGFLTERQTLPTGRIISDVRTSARAGSRTSVHLYDDVLVTPPPDDSLQRGNLLLVFRRGDEVGDYGEIVVPTGLLRVKGAEEAGHYRATVVRMFGPVLADQELLDIQPFALGSSAHAVPIEDGVSGQVIRLRDPHELSQRQQPLFIDKGANDGLRPGDLMKIYRNQVDEVHGGSVEQVLAIGVVVSTRSSTSTVVIVELYSGEVGPASLVRQIGRMPS